MKKLYLFILIILINIIQPLFANDNDFKLTKEENFVYMVIGRTEYLVPYQDVSVKFDNTRNEVYIYIEDFITFHRNYNTDREYRDMKRYIMANLYYR